jgi:farnesol dehydrogenase
VTTLVTGATGFIGRRLAERLVRRGEAVRLLSRSGSSALEGLGAGVQVVRGELSDLWSLRDAAAGCERVFHVAGYAKNWSRDPRTFGRVNVDGLRHLLEAASSEGVRRVVVTSSSVTLGPSNGAPTTEATIRTVPFFTEYEQSKAIAEADVRRFVEGGMDIVMVNPTRVFGPGVLTEGNSVTKMIQMYLAGTYRTLPGDGRAVGNYAFIGDVVEGHLLAMEKGRPGHRYVLGGEDASYAAFFRCCAEVSGVERWMFNVPRRLMLAMAHVEERRARLTRHYPLITPGWARTFLADWSFSSGKAVQELGYRITPLREALEATVAWLREEGRTS